MDRAWFQRFEAADPQHRWRMLTEANREQFERLLRKYRVRQAAEAAPPHVDIL